MAGPPASSTKSTSSTNKKNAGLFRARQEEGVGGLVTLFKLLASITFLRSPHSAGSESDRCRSLAIGAHASSMLDLRLDFILKYQNADSSTIKVKVDSVSKPHTFSSATNTVHLKKAHAGGAKSLVDIYYCCLRTSRWCRTISKSLRTCSIRARKRRSL